MVLNMPENKKVNPLQFDKRVMHRFVQNLKMSSQDLERYLNKLPDLESQSEDIAPKIFSEKKGHGGH